MGRRIAAGAALVLLVAAPIAALVFAFGHVVLVAATVAAVVAVGAFGWIAATRTGARRALAAVAALVCVAALVTVFFVVLPVLGALRDVLVVALLAALASITARYALDRTRPAADVAVTPRTQRSRHPVVFMNPRSGGGKVGRFDLVREARRRGIEAVVLEPGDDLRALAEDAIARGADAVGVAGGDGSQAIVATLAIEHGVPFVCVPAGTRNHLALDLGVDRDDVVGALDAFAAGGERLVDIGLVGDRTFVNNVSFGVYGEVVQSRSYRDAKLKTAAAEIPELLGPGGRAPVLRFRGPDGVERATRDLVLVSNNPYDVGTVGQFGTRPRMDTGRLGILSVRVDDARDAGRFTALALAGRVWDFAGCETWSATTFVLDADGPVAAGIDGESVRLEPPVRFGVAPRALRVWLAEGAPGTRPRATRARLGRASVPQLWNEALGRPVNGATGAGNGRAATGAATSPSRRT